MPLFKLLLAARSSVAKIVLIFSMLAAVTSEVSAQTVSASGTGFFITSNGIAATNWHVVEGATRLIVTDAGGRQYNASILRADKANDLALLKVDTSSVPYLQLQTSTGIRRGERVYALGFPRAEVQGVEPKLTDGVISSLSGLADDPTAFQISNPIQPGNSGGPLFTEEGKVIGVVTATLDARKILAATGSLPQNVNYAMKSNYLLELISSVGSITLPTENPRSTKKKLTDVIADAEKALIRISAINVSNPSPAKLVPPIIQDSPTINKIQNTGQITLGVRDSSGGLSYALGGGRYGGFHVALCERIARSIEKQIGKKLDIRYTPVTSQNRIPMIQNGTIDLECGSTINNPERQKLVSFAVTTYVEEVRIAVRTNSGIFSLGDLNGKVVVSTLGTTSIQSLKNHEKARNINFTEIYGRNHSESFQLLENGRADAMIMDGQILAGNIANSRTPSGFIITGEIIDHYPIGIMINKDDPKFKEFVDATLKSWMTSGEIANMHDQWFVQPIPPRGTRIGYPANGSTKAAWARPSDSP